MTTKYKIVFSKYIRENNKDMKSKFDNDEKKEFDSEDKARFFIIGKYGSTFGYYSIKRIYEK